MSQRQKVGRQQPKGKREIVSDNEKKRVTEGIEREKREIERGEGL